VEPKVFTLHSLLNKYNYSFIQTDIGKSRPKNDSYSYEKICPQQSESQVYFFAAMTLQKPLYETKVLPKEGECVFGKKDQSVSEERERHSSSSSSVSDCNVATTETLQQVKRVSLSVYEKIKQDMIIALEANDLATVKRLQKYLQYPELLKLIDTYQVFTVTDLAFKAREDLKTRISKSTISRILRDLQTDGYLQLAVFPYRNMTAHVYFTETCDELRRARYVKRFTDCNVATTETLQQVKRNGEQYIVPPSALKVLDHNTAVKILQKKINEELEKKEKEELEKRKEEQKQKLKETKNKEQQIRNNHANARTIIDQYSPDVIAKAVIRAAYKTNTKITHKTVICKECMRILQYGEKKCDKCDGSTMPVYDLVEDYITDKLKHNSEFQKYLKLLEGK